MSACTYLCMHVCRAQIASSGWKTEAPGTLFSLAASRLPNDRLRGALTGTGVCELAGRLADTTFGWANRCPAAPASCWGYITGLVHVKDKPFCGLWAAKDPKHGPKIRSETIACGVVHTRHMHQWKGQQQPKKPVFPDLRWHRTSRRRRTKRDRVAQYEATHLAISLRICRAQSMRPAKQR